MQVSALFSKRGCGHVLHDDVEEQLVGLVTGGVEGVLQLHDVRVPCVSLYPASIRNLWLNTPRNAIVVTL